MLGSDNKSYIGLIKYLYSIKKINIYVGHGLELNNADVSVEEVDVNDSGFNVGEVEVDVSDGPIVSSGPIVALKSIVVDTESTGVIGPGTDVEPIGATSPSNESPMEPPPFQIDPSVDAKQTTPVGPISVVGFTRLERDNVKAANEDINKC
ncbi:hypothetical protein V6N13_039850 [Hibiscus sabdariffa]|uniref:Uncharacterized protein n=1 Tax=Hibiscus sabdariffa TaxID=183260 RepID=A0ABR2SV25_9ROSI